MFILLLLVPIIVEIFAFIEVAGAIGWALAATVLIGTSLLGVALLRIQGRAALRRVSLAVSERRAPGAAALDAALGFLGCSLLVVPGFLSDALGVLLLLPPTRALVRRWISRRYATRVMSFAGAAARATSWNRVVRPADIESTAVEEDRPQLDPGARTDARP
jgi:UPF0716 protein FxsA